MAAHRIRNVVHEVLLYSHDLDEGRHRGPGSTSRRWAELEDSVQTALREAFFDLLYVDRPMVDELYNGLNTHRLTLLSAPRGSGKTTVLLAFERLFRERHSQGEHFDRERDAAGASVHYVNIRQFEAARRDQSADDSRPRLTVCAFIFTKLQRYFFPTLDDLHAETPASERALRRGWVEWKTLNCHTHSVLKASLDDEMLADRASRERWEELLWSSDFKTLRQEAEQAFEIQDGTFRLGKFLDFLNSELDHRVILLIDNIDRYPRRLHKEVFGASARLAANAGRVTHVVMAVRDASLDDLELDHLDHPVHHLQLTGDEPEEAFSDADPQSVFADIFERRLRALAKILKGEFRLREGEYAQLRSHVSENLEQIGIESFDQYVAAHLDTYQRIHTEIGDSRFRADLDFLRWNNNSFRSAATHLFNMIDAITLGTDPIFPRPLGHFSRSMQAHDLRNLAWRHIVFGDRYPPSVPDVINVFVDDETDNDAPTSVVFQRLKILQYLLNHKGRRVRVADLAQDFRAVGVPHGAVLRHLVELEKSRNMEGEGLIAIDLARNNGSSAPISDDSTIEVRPAGRFFVRHLLRSCEYMFWTSCYHDLHPEFWPNEELSVDHIWSDGYRLESAITFLERFVCEETWSELGVWPGHQPTREAVERFKTYRTMFVDDSLLDPPVPAALVPGSIATGLLNFVPHAFEVSESDQRRMIERLEHIREDALAVVRSLDGASRR